jgi:hypothetical protein
MAKKSAKARRAAVQVSRSPEGRAFVKTGDTMKAIEDLLFQLDAAKRGDTGWGLKDHAKVAGAELLLKAALLKIKCPPTQSFPGPGGKITLKPMK